MRVLLADNDPVWLDLVDLDLGLEGHEVVGRATSGEEVLRRLREAVDAPGGLSPTAQGPRR
jgi:CheY-like chemotaxis protein